MDDAKLSFCCLNDDCLLHFFKYLNIMDILSASKTCVRLYDVTEPILMKKCKTIDLGEILNNAYDINLNRSLYCNFLNDLGKYIISLSINGRDLSLMLEHDNEVQLLNNIYRACESLEELDLAEVTNLKHNYYAAENHEEYPALAKLKVLKLQKCAVQDRYLLDTLDKSCCLTELTLDACELITGTFLHCLNGLEKLSVLYHPFNLIEHSNIVQFCVTNAPSLTHLKLRTGWMLFDYSLSIDGLVNVLPKLEYLNTDCLLATNKLTVQLEHLKTLHMSFDAESIAPLLRLLAEYNKVIEELGVYMVKRPITLDSQTKGNLLKLTTLQRLTLFEIKIDSTFFIECAKTLKNLRVFALNSSNGEFGLNDDDILNFVQNAYHLRELHVGFSGIDKISPNVLVKLDTVWQSLNKSQKLIFGINFHHEYVMVAKKLYENVNSIEVKWEPKSSEDCPIGSTICIVN